MYRDKRGIYYKNIFYKILGVPSPSLNVCYGGMEAVRQAACDKMVKRARLVEKWEIRHLRKTEKVVMFMAGMITKMSWAFRVQEESYDRATRTRTILKIKKVYDVSAVSIPANGDTEISARSFASRSYEAEKQERLYKRVQLLKIRASL